MLIVRTYIARSTINGYGVFAQDFIPAGSLVWQFTPGIDLELSSEQMGRLPTPARDYLRHFVNETGPDTFLLCSDNARFMNHSDRPNLSCAEERNLALRDIEAGEEITCNYREFDISFVGF